MKVLIVNNMAPFIWGGAEELAENLKLALIKSGHEADVLRIPFQSDPFSQIPNQIAIVEKLDLINVDKVIALKFPAYLIRHPNKTIWLLHQFRQAYDLYHSGQSNFGLDSVDKEVREVIWGADNQAISRQSRVFCNSPVTQDRLAKFNGIEAEILLPPVNDPHLFVNEAPDGYIFAGGRLNSMKRQELLLRALALTAKHVKLCLAGPPESLEYKVKIESLADELGVTDRVMLDLNFLSRERYASYVNRSIAVAYIPFDEDSFGYVAMEGAQASKPIITTTDSGGVSQFVRHQVDGWICEPTASSLAKAMNFATENLNVSKAMGEASKEKLSALDLTWEATVRTLLS